MKTKLPFILAVAAILGLAAGSNYIINSARLDGFIYGNKSGLTDTIITFDSDSLGQYKLQNIANPVGPLDAVNFRTLLSSGGGGGWDSIPFNPLTGDLQAFFGGSNIYTTSIDGRYLKYADSTLYVTITQLNDSLNYLDSVIMENQYHVFEIRLPSSTTVSGRISGATAGVDYPADWSLAAGVSVVDLVVTHNLGRRVTSVSIFAIDGTSEQQLFNTAAYNGVITPDVNSVRIQSLATIQKAIKIYIIFK